jgi:hypothetical protein
MLRTGLRIVLAVCALALASHAALADKRVALVVGNAAYAFAPLSNTLNDASDIAAALRHLRFDVNATHMFFAAALGSSVRGCFAPLTATSTAGTGIAMASASPGPCPNPAQWARFLNYPS